MRVSPLLYKRHKCLSEYYQNTNTIRPRLKHNLVQADVKQRIQCESKKIPLLRFSGIFSQMVGNFLSIFYTPIIRSYLRERVRYGRWWTFFEHMIWSGWSGLIWH